MGSSADRRRQRRQAESVAASQKRKKPIDKWLAAASMALSLVYFLLPKHPTVIVVTLLMVFLLLVHPLLNFWWIEKAAWRKFSALVLLGLGLAYLGVRSWPPQGLSEAQARLTVSRMQGTISETGEAESVFHVMFRNTGSRPAIGLKHTVAFRVVEKPVSVEELGELVRSVSYPYTQTSSAELQPNDPTEHYFSYPANSIPLETRRRLRSGQLRLYVIALLKYRQHLLSPEDVIVTEACSYFSNGDFALAHTCDWHNRVYVDCKDRKCPFPAATAQAAITKNEASSEANRTA